MISDVWTHLPSKMLSVHASGLVLSHRPDSSMQCELRSAIVSEIPDHLTDADINLQDLMDQAKLEFVSSTKH